MAHNPRPKRRKSLRLALLLLPFLLVSPGVLAQPSAVLEDDLQILAFPQRLMAIAASGGGQREIDLEIGEEVLWTGINGKVGMVLTNRRMLAISTEVGNWQAKRYRRTETVPEPPLLGGRVAILVTKTRVIGFDGGSGNLVESSIGPSESILDLAVGQNVAVAVTNRRTLGLSPFRGGFFQASVGPGERYAGVATVANSATVTTSRRLLVFRSPSGSWEERVLELRDRR